MTDMPGTIQNAAPITVLPQSLCRAFVHERAYPIIENEYRNGESPRPVLGTNRCRAHRRRRGCAVHALDRALHNGLHQFYEPLRSVRLIDSRRS